MRFLRFAPIPFAMILTLGINGRAFAQDQPQPHAEHHPEAEVPAPGPPAQGPDMMARCRQMMAEQREGMMKDMQARMNARAEVTDKKLNDLLAEVNKARGNDKVEALAKVVTELAVQRSRIRQDMMKMQEEMMSHMMEHMQNAAMPCPMMQANMQGMTHGMAPGTHPAPAK